MIFKVAFACIAASWCTLKQHSVFLVQFASIDSVDVSDEICSLIERLSVRPILVEVRKQLRREFHMFHVFGLLLSVWVVTSLPR